MPRIGKSSWTPKVWEDPKCLTTKKKVLEGGFDQSTIWLREYLVQTTTKFWKVVDPEDPIDLQDLANNQHPDVENIEKVMHRGTVKTLLLELVMAMKPIGSFVGDGAPPRAGGKETSYGPS